MRLFRWLISTRRGKTLLAISGVAAIPLIALGWWLGSPLFLNKTVDEEFPRTVGAVIPASMTRAEAEETMEDAAAIDDTASEGMTAAMLEPATIAVKSGSFRDEDRSHRGSGSATVYALGDGTNVLRLEELSVTNGPDLFVLLMVDPEGRDKAQGYLELGRLKGNRGNQNYEIPSGVDTGDYNAVMIYCRAFSVVFSTAPFGDEVA